jgi:two-component system sensor histidine kinase TctE
VRVAYIWVRWRCLAAPLALVQVAETREKRSVLATEIIKGVMLPQFVILPLAVLLVWLALVRGIKPLNQLEERIRARSPDDLSRWTTARAAGGGAAGVVRQRPADAAERFAWPRKSAFWPTRRTSSRRRWRACACRPTWRSAKAPAPKSSSARCKQIGRSSIRATHTVNQLLALARAEGSGAAHARLPCDWPRLTMEVVRDSVPARAWTSTSTWATTAPSRRCRCDAGRQPHLLKELVRNLVDNAINYTPSEVRPGMVTARVLADPLAMCWCCRWRTTAPACPRPSASWFSSLFTGRWAPRPMARAWGDCPS